MENNFILLSFGFLIRKVEITRPLCTSVPGLHVREASCEAWATVSAQGRVLVPQWLELLSP